MISKTLIGKENYLFLQNDSGQELKIHNENLDLVADNFYLKYSENINKYLLVVFPNKSLIHKKYLPDEYDLKYRPGYIKYNDYLKNHILDGYPILKDKLDTYYKTDTHINLKGNYIIYLNFINKIKNLYNLEVEERNIVLKEKIIEDGLSTLNLGIGDLTWDINLNNQDLKEKTDTYFYSEQVRDIYVKYIFINDSDLRIKDKYLNDVTNKYLNNNLTWDIISNYILYQKNNIKNKNKVLIFYDSLLLSGIDLYLDLFGEVYFSKSIYDINLINLIKPDYIFEFRCERFLF